MKIFGIKIPMMYSLLIWIIAWEIMGQLEMALILPPFSGVIEAVIAMSTADNFLAAVQLSLYSFAIGLLISAARQ